MSKAVSYYDWEQGFKDKSKSIPQTIPFIKKKRVNSLGIPNQGFKSFIEQWKEKNL